MNEDMVKKMRGFNRYYTVWLDMMNKDYLGTDLSWPEARVLFEIYIYPEISATDLCEHFRMDKSYMSRILGKFEKHGLITRELILGSKGLKKIRLTQEGIKEAKKIDESGNRQIVDKLNTLDDETCGRLCEAMVFIEETLRHNDKKEGKRDEQ